MSESIPVITWLLSALDRIDLQDELVSTCQELSLVPLKGLTNGALRRALKTIFRLFDDTKGAKSPLHLPT